MFNNLKRLLGLSSTPDPQPANPNPLAPPYNHGQSYPQPGNYMYWNGLPNYQGNLYSMPGAPGMYAQAHGPINPGFQNLMVPFNPYLGPPMPGYPPLMQLPQGGIVNAPNQVPSRSEAIIPSDTNTVAGFQRQGQDLQSVEMSKIEVPSGTSLKDSDKGDISAFDWPDGDQIRKQVLGHEEPGWKDSKWVWRSKGGVGVEKRTCQGVYECSNTGCGRLYRPRTDVNAQAAQLQKGCSFCHSQLKSYSCDAYFLYYREIDERDKVLYSIWKHFGHHSHKRPPGGRLSSQQQKAVDAQVLRRHDSTAHVYRTGDTGPGSQPLGEISEMLANPRAARYQVAQSRSRLGISLPSSVKGGFSILTSLAGLPEEFKKPFLVGSSVHGPTYLMFQTPFMRSLVEESVESWASDDDGHHGFVTDGDHSFFRSGVLLATCTFNAIMQSWAPALYTWILRQDIEHHRPHFRHISDIVVETVQQCQIQFQPEYLLHVMDFSASQRTAHAEEYANAKIRLNPAFNTLTKASQDIERNTYLEEARRAEVGCQFHFWQSATCLKSNGILIPRGSSGAFDRILRILVSERTSREEFDENVKLLRTTFPRIDGWLSWWLRPTFASMIFPSHSAVDRTISNQVPSTSNAAEHHHSLLHHAVGTDHDLIPGIQNLFLHVQELERQFSAIKGGHYDPAAPRQYRPSARKQYDENDGRAPDTELSLHPQGIQDSTTRNAHYLQSYRWWKGHSCFYDNSLEAWFRAYSCWPTAIQLSFRKAVPHQSFLSTVFEHFDRRLKCVHKLTDKVAVTRELELMQVLTDDWVYNKRKLYKPNEYGCSMSWLFHAVQKDEHSREVQAHFGVDHLLVQRCVHGHSSSRHATDGPEMFQRIFQDDSRTVRDILGPHASLTLSNYFQHLVPRSRGGNFSQGTTPLHVLPDNPCAEPTCSSQSSTIHISTSWPQILHLIPDLRSDGTLTDPVQFTNTLRIADADGSHVTYELIARVCYDRRRQHFTSQFRLDNLVYTYDDMLYDGALHQHENLDLLESTSRNMEFYVYHRTSAKSMTKRDIEGIRADHDRLAPLPQETISVADSSEGEAQSPSPIPKERTGRPRPRPKGPTIPTSVASKLGDYKPDSYVSCISQDCGVTDVLERFTIMMSCTLCKSKWHDQCIEKTWDTTIELDPLDEWCCPECIHVRGGRWDQKMIGRFILHKPTPASPLYPAEILGRSSTHAVHLRWYSGNLYSKTDAPQEAEFILKPLECFVGSERLDFTRMKQETFGSVAIPAWAEEDSANCNGYTNPKLQQSLDASYNMIIQILKGSVNHPVMGLWLDWTSKNHWNSRTNHLAKLDSTLNFQDQFDLNILPGDLSLIEDFGVPLRHDLGQSDFNFLGSVATLLFKVVAMRVYLGRNPCDDEQIFYLAYNPSSDKRPITLPDDPLSEAKCGSVVRHLTTPERVQVGSKSSYRLGHHVTNEPFPEDFRLVDVLDASGQPYQFFHTTSTGLFMPRALIPSQQLKYTPSPNQPTKPGLTSNPSPSKPRLIMEDYHANQLAATNKHASESEVAPKPSAKQGKRRRSGDDDYSPQNVVQPKSNSTTDKHQRNDGPEQSAPKRRSSRLNNSSK